MECKTSGGARCKLACLLDVLIVILFHGQSEITCSDCP